MLHVNLKKDANEILSSLEGVSEAIIISTTYINKKIMLGYMIKAPTLIALYF